MTQLVQIGPVSILVTIVRTKNDARVALTIKIIASSQLCASLVSIWRVVQDPNSQRFYLRVGKIAQCSSTSILRAPSVSMKVQ